jgi:hypothetical protein
MMADNQQFGGMTCIYFNTRSPMGCIVAQNPSFSERSG